MYSLETIKEKDLNKIERDFKGRSWPVIKGVVAHFPKMKNRHKWAVDHDADSYLFLVPGITCSFTSSKINYLFFWEGSCFHLELKNWLSNDIVMRGEVVDTRIEDLKAAISMAFEVHQRFGLGDQGFSRKDTELTPAFVKISNF